ncbi:hypothetical protein BaRGS_00003844 [Batillaria attramentaria]|uniref:Uncharacterized protein n=1 Tax=Batillaria attramentaria TaxID=370345 RepID=A0ABD0LZZ1_9CAEN
MTPKDNSVDEGVKEMRTAMMDEDTGDCLNELTKLIKFPDFWEPDNARYAIADDEYLRDATPYRLKPTSGGGWKRSFPLSRRAKEAVRQPDQLPQDVDVASPRKR